MTLLLWLASVAPVVLGVLGLARVARGAETPVPFRPWVVAATATFAGALWAFQWIKYFGSVGGVSDPSQTAHIVSSVNVAAPPAAAAVLVLLGLVLAVVLRARTKAMRA